MGRISSVLEVGTRADGMNICLRGGRKEKSTVVNWRSTGGFMVKDILAVLLRSIKYCVGIVSRNAGRDLFQWRDIVASSQRYSNRISSDQSMGDTSRGVSNCHMRQYHQVTPIDPLNVVSDEA